MANEKQKTIDVCYILFVLVASTHTLDLQPKGAVKTIKMGPSSYPNGMKPEESLPELIQDWNKNGECPKGTIPIIRTPNDDSILTEDLIHECAVVFAQRNVYYGSYATINVWNPKTEKREFSLSQIWLLSRIGALTDRNSIEAGWMVSPRIFGDNRTRFFIYWTDKNTGNWWLQLQGNVLGYWPGSIFTSLAQGAKEFIWGGEIINARSRGHHTTTQMGSDHFSGEGYRKASLFRDVGVVDDLNTRRDPGYLQPLMTNRTCYDLRISENKRTDFYYGGPGYSTKCL